MSLVLKLATLPKPDLNNITRQWINISKEFDGGVISDELFYHHFEEVATAKTPEFLLFIQDCYSQFRDEPDTSIPAGNGFAVHPDLLNVLASLEAHGITAIADLEFIDAIKKLAHEVDHSKTWVFFYVEKK
ncbi:hypothetical protein TOTORO_01640 [Serratia phage vB_SmaS-Totoro]|nr:hypothetical protein TOTORO_01640 [Serratia phage vB_SmaS-Totoro]